MLCAGSRRSATRSGRRRARSAQRARAFFTRERADPHTALRSLSKSLFGEETRRPRGGGSLAPRDLASDLRARRVNAWKRQSFLKGHTHKEKVYVPKSTGYSARPRSLDHKNTGYSLFPRERARCFQRQRDFGALPECCGERAKRSARCVPVACGDHRGRAPRERDGAAPLDVRARERRPQSRPGAAESGRCARSTQRGTRL